MINPYGLRKNVTTCLLSVILYNYKQSISSIQDVCHCFD